MTSSLAKKKKVAFSHRVQKASGFGSTALHYTSVDAGKEQEATAKAKAMLIFVSWFHGKYVHVYAPHALRRSTASIKDVVGQAICLS